MINLMETDLSVRGIEEARVELHESIIDLHPEKVVHVKKEKMIN